MNVVAEPTDINLTNIDLSLALDLEGDLEGSLVQKPPQVSLAELD